VCVSKNYWPGQFMNFTAVGTVAYCCAIFQVMIFFSAHGVPVSYVENAGDPYRDQMEECIYLIMQELKARGTYNEYTLAYQVGCRT
jgi:protoheme ferro-lyase